MTTFYTLKKQVPLKPGQTIGFKEHHGYYAKPAPKKKPVSRKPVKKTPAAKPPVTQAARLAALKVAVSQIGQHEVGQNNWGPKVSLYLKSAGISFPAAWCMAFVHWCYGQIGFQLGGGASVGNFMEWAKAHGEIVTRPFRGDIVGYQFTSDDWPDHVGIVEKVLSIRIVGCWWLQTIEGNTGASGAVSDPGTGMDAVYRKRRLVRRNRVVFARIKEQSPA